MDQDVGNPLLTCLHVIQLLEADMNLAFCLQLVYHALDHNALNKWNFGNLPGASCLCLSALLLKVLSYDYIRLRCTTAVIFNNNAKACCDRIVPSLGLMATE